MLLNLTGLDRDPCNVKAWIFCDLNEVEFRGVALTHDHPKRSRQRSIRCIVSRDAQASSRARAIHTDIVPSGISNHRIEHGRSEFLNMSPAAAERLPKRIQITRQNATIAQEYGMQLHSCTLLGGKGGWGPIDNVKPSLDAMEWPDEECSRL